PVSRENVRYLAESAVITRLMVGLVRVNENKPSKLKDPELTPRDKKKAVWERAFVEIIGTLGYLLVLHGGQDLTAKIFEASNRYNVPHQVENADWYRNGKLTQAEKKELMGALSNVFGEKW